MTWKLSLPCTRAEAETLKDDIVPLAMLEPPPALMTSEVDPSAPDAWRLDAYFETQPDETLVAALKALAPSAKQATPTIEKLEEEDWVALSQDGLEPIVEGRFVVHTPAHRSKVPAGATGIEIEASRAFGTGQHETTSGCLAMLDRMKRRGERFTDIADIGTGSGILAFAALALWPGARVIASDNDPIATMIAAENASVNAAPLGENAGQIELVTAAGFAHRRLKQRAPYDLVIANILAGPLIGLAPAMANAVAPRGSLVLAGLLARQAGEVATAYRRNRFRLAEREVRGEWAILRLVKRPPVRGRKAVSRG